MESQNELPYEDTVKPMPLTLLLVVLYIAFALGVLFHIKYKVKPFEESVDSLPIIDSIIITIRSLHVGACQIRTSLCGV